MAFDNFCIFPKTGVFVLKESVSSFEPNSTEPTEAASEKIVSMLSHDGVPYLSFDPVNKLRTCLEPAYEQVKLIYTMDMSYTDKDGVMLQLDKIDQASTIIAETLEKTYNKLMNKCNLYNGRCGINYITQSFKNYAGIILPKTKYLMSKGYAGYDFTVDVLPCLDHYRIKNTLATLIDNQNTMMCKYYDISTMDLLNPYDRSNYQMFDSFSDFYNCYFNDTERLCRLERKNQYQISLDSIIASSKSCDNIIDYSCETCDGVHAKILEFISNSLSSIKHRVYEMQVSIMDHDVADPNGFTDSIRKLNATCLNLFNFIAIYMICDAYSLREYVERKKVIDIFINNIVKELKSAGE